MRTTVYMTEDGLTFGKTKATNPYDFDPITHYVADDVPEDAKVSSLYCDRLKDHYPGTFDELSKKHFGNVRDFWEDRSPESIEAFLQELLDRPTLRLAGIIETCNVANGYPVWQFRKYDHA